MKHLLTIASLAFSLNAFSNTKIVDTSEAVNQALQDFQANSSTQIVAKFNGFKAWPVSGGVKVKIYVKGEASVDSSCHRHSENEPFECH